MKINHLLLLLLVVLYAPLAANGQDVVFLPPLTVNNGTSVGSTVPFRSDCVNYGTHSQFIIPYADLTAMRGGTLSKLTLYSNSPYANWGSARFSIYMAEVTYNKFTDLGFVDWNSMSEVYTGSLSVHNNMMQIVLDSAFTYYGGNLLIGFKEVALGQSNVNLIWRGANFPSANTAMISYCYSAYGLPYNAFAHFLPKMTFEYYVPVFPMIEVTEEDITPYSASFSWVEPSSNVTGYKYQYNRISEDFTDNWIELPPTATSVILENLDPVTEYFFRIKACYGDHESAMRVLDFKTDCPDYATNPYYENFDSYVVADEWIPSRRTLPDCWDYINTSTNPNDNVYPSMLYLSLLPNYANSPSNSLHFYIDNHLPLYEAKPQYVILPAMQNINRLRVKLYARSYVPHYTFSCTFKVGVMEETETGPEFISIKEITPSETYQLYTIDMDGYEGDGERIAIWMEVPNTYYGSVYIDDIEIEKLPMFTMPISSYSGNSGGWHLISSPLAGETHPEAVSQLINNNVNSPDFDLYRFNPNPENQGMNWENWKQEGDHYHFVFEPGRGYLYANANSVNLAFLGAPYSGNGEVALLYDEDESLGGWNLVGNPFTVPAYIGRRAYYRMNEDGSGFMPASTGSAIGVMEGVFVYTETDGEVLTFNTTPPDRIDEQVSFGISKKMRSGFSSTIDRAIVRFGEGDVLRKFQFNEEIAKVYIPQNGLDYAVVSAEDQGEMPINFRADENGTYTISLSCENVEFSYLHLFDNKTGTDVDLLNTPNYTFNATTTDYESRFKLVYATGSSIEGDSFTFLNSNGNFSIFGIEGEATLQVLDVMGRMLSTETFNGSIEKRLDVAPGVYFIRLVSGADVKTQKIVVR